MPRDADPAGIHGDAAIGRWFPARQVYVRPAGTTCGSGVRGTRPRAPEPPCRPRRPNGRAASGR
jgi:hypothetical protein